VSPAGVQGTAGSEANTLDPVLANERGMRTAVDEAISAISTARLPRSLFAQRDEIPPAATSYWLFVPSPSGYSVREHTGSAPPRGGDLVLDEVTYRVALIGRSPFLDGRMCAYLERM